MKSLLKKNRAHLTWTLLILVYLYWTMLPEVVFINGSNNTIEQLKIVIPDDDKIWRNIKHGESKSFRYKISGQQGQYKIEIIQSDGSIIRSTIKGIQPWNFGHKLFIEFLPDKSLRTDFSYSFFKE